MTCLLTVLESDAFTSVFGTARGLGIAHSLEDERLKQVLRENGDYVVIDNAYKVALVDEAPDPHPRWGHDGGLHVHFSVQREGVWHGVGRICAFKALAETDSIRQLGPSGYIVSEDFRAQMRHWLSQRM